MATSASAMSIEQRNDAVTGELSAEEFAATVRASLGQLDLRDREQLGQWLYRRAEQRGLVLRLGFDELSGAAHLGELGVLIWMFRAIHRVSPALVGELLAEEGDPGRPTSHACTGALGSIADRTRHEVAGARDDQRRIARGAWDERRGV